MAFHERPPYAAAPHPRDTIYMLPRTRSETSNLSCDSSVELIHHVSQHPDAPTTRSSVLQNMKNLSWTRRKARDAELPQFDAEKQHGPAPLPDPIKYRWWHGWSKIALGSYFNMLLFLLPAAWILSVTLEKSHTLVCIFCIVTFLPLVRLHDLATADLSVRLGQSKTGLVNATMSNTVEIVIAITALRKCELRVVQASLIGGILSKLLLVLGMCFFAGGLRFSEQGFDATATQMHSSLLSLSVGALLLPAAYHFALDTSSAKAQDDQRTDLLKMSRGVSVILFVIYIAYLIFQFGSHTHLYEDSAAPSKKFHDSIIKRAGRADSEETVLDRAEGKCYPDQEKDLDEYEKDLASPRVYRETDISESTTSLDLRRTDTMQTAVEPPPTPTVRLVNVNVSAANAELHHRHPHSPTSSKSSPTGERSGYEDILAYYGPSAVRPQRPDPAFHPEHPRHRVPELSWTMVALLLVTVPVLVAFNAELLIENLDGFTDKISKDWIGLILLPTVSSLAECITAMNVSYNDQLSLSMSVAVGSTIQTSLCVIPFCVLVGWAMDKPMTLLFDPFESVVLYLSVNVMGYVVGDGKSNWLEGVILICFYVVIAVSNWFYTPGSPYLSSLTVCAFQADLA